MYGTKNCEKQNKHFMLPSSKRRPSQTGEKETTDSFVESDISEMPQYNLYLLSKRVYRVLFLVFFALLLFSVFSLSPYYSGRSILHYTTSNFRSGRKSLYLSTCPCFSSYLALNYLQNIRDKVRFLPFCTRQPFLSEKKNQQGTPETSSSSFQGRKIVE